MSERAHGGLRRQRRHALVRRASGEEGVALVEFALILPVLVLLLFGMIDFGKAFNYWIDQTHLANEGARWAAVNKNPASSGTLQEYIRDQATSNELRNGGTSSVTNPLQVCIDFRGDADPEAGDPVRVTVTASYNWLSVLGLASPSTTITGSSTMRLEKEPGAYTAGCT